MKISQILAAIASSPLNVPLDLIEAAKVYRDGEDYPELNSVYEQALAAIAEPWRHFDYDPYWPGADWFAPTEIKKLAKFSGEDLLLWIGNDQYGKIVARWNGYFGRRAKVYPVGFDSFIAQNQSPIEFLDNG